eukprot:1030180-Prymnesium_polylepis.3
MLLEPCTGAGRAASGEGTKAEAASDETDSIIARLWRLRQRTGQLRGPTCASSMASFRGFETAKF